jgi:3-oxoacyl-(acyl-carrier-protein) synthase
MMQIFITGYGVISSIGLNLEENYNSLKNQVSGIKFTDSPIYKNYKVGNIPYSNEELATKFDLKTKGSRTAILGMIAAKEAFKGHLLDSEIRTGLISGTSVGGMDLTEHLYKDYLKGNLHAEAYRHHPSGMSTIEIAKELGLENCFLNTISTACSSAANAIMQGARLIQNNVLDRVIVGGTDALTEFTFNGFRSLMIFDEAWCRPFDNSRNGLNLGEGAGYIILESEQSISRTKSNKIGLLSGWNSSSDAYHQTASSPEGYGAILSMRGAIEMAGLGLNEIHYVNAHGTSTPNNDLSESHALKTVFEHEVPSFSSTKSYTGHTLAASGGIEAVFALLAIKNGALYPNLNFSEAITETQLTPQLIFEENKVVKHVLSNSFGFGGNNSSILISGLN